jgi:hypothetical protein
MRMAGISALDLQRRSVGQVRPVSFAGVDDKEACLARGGEHLPARSHRGMQARNIVAERGAKPAGLQKVPLHIDDDERRSTDVDGDRRRLSLDGPQCHGSLRCRLSFAQAAKSGPS